MKHMNTRGQTNIVAIILLLAGVVLLLTQAGFSSANGSITGAITDAFSPNGKEISCNAEFTTNSLTDASCEVVDTCYDRDNFGLLGFLGFDEDVNVRLIAAGEVIDEATVDFDFGSNQDSKNVNLGGCISENTDKVYVKLYSENGQIQGEWEVFV